MFTYLPGDGKRKKAVVQQAITMPLSCTGGFEEIQDRRSFVPFEGMTTIR